MSRLPTGPLAEASDVIVHEPSCTQVERGKDRKTGANTVILIFHDEQGAPEAFVLTPEDAEWLGAALLDTVRKVRGEKTH